MSDESKFSTCKNHSAADSSAFFGISPTISLLTGDDPVAGRFPLHHFEYAVDGSLLKVGQVHRNLRQPADQKSRAFDEAHAAARKADRFGDLLRNLDVGGVEKNVVSNQKFARANDRRSGRRMHPGFTIIGFARRVGYDVRANAFELSAPDVFQVLPLGRGCRRFVEVNRDLISLPDLFAHVPRHGHTVFNGHAIDRNEGHDVRRTHAGMRSLVPVQVDQLCRLADAANRGLLDRFPLPHQSDDAAVVIGVHLAIKQEDAVHLHGLDDGVDFGFVTAFRKIGNTLNQS